MCLYLVKLSMNISILTSNHLRHKAFAKSLCDILDIKTVVFEEKSASTQQFHKKEENYFKDLAGWQPRCQYIACPCGFVNKGYVINTLKEQNLDYLFIFGSSLLKEEVFSIPKKGCINIHTGLVQHFRGVDSSLWAIYEEKPEAIGATIHYVDNSIDGGGIIAQKRTNLSIGDDLDDIFFKTCKTGFELLQEKMDKILEGKIKAKKLISRGKLYQKKDLNKSIVVKVNKKLPKVLKKYLHKKLDSKVEPMK